MKNGLVVECRVVYTLLSTVQLDEKCGQSGSSHNLLSQDDRKGSKVRFQPLR